MMRTKVYTSEGEVIFISNKPGQRINTPSKSTSRRQQMNKTRFVIERQAPSHKKDEQDHTYMVDPDDIVDEEVLDEEVIEQPGDDDDDDDVQLETVPWSSQRDATESASAADVRGKLAKWSSDYRIADDAMDDLLGLLKVHQFPDLPASSRKLRAYLKSSGSADETDYAADDFDFGRSPTSAKGAKISRKRPLEDGKGTVTVDVTHLNELMEKMDIIDKKLDTLTANGTAHSRMLKNVLSVIAAVKSTIAGQSGEEEYLDNPELDPDFESNFVKISFPVKDQAEFLRLEKFSLEDDGEAALRQCFAEEPSHDLYEFLRANVERLFKNTSRYSWSGKTAINNKHHEDSLQASSLNIFRILTECAMKRFKKSNDLCTEKLKRALQNYNAAVNAKVQRSLNKSEKPTQEEESTET